MTNWLKVLKRYSVWCDGLSSRTKSIIGWFWTSVLVGVCVFNTFRTDSSWWSCVWILLAFWLGYAQGATVEHCHWRERYDRLWDHHKEGLRQSSKKISELQAQLSGVKRGQR
jgi:thiosulfate reductase cytochrome b subunit